MGIVHKPNINSYWSRDELYNMPIFQKLCHEIISKSFWDFCISMTMLHVMQKMQLMIACIKYNPTPGFDMQAMSESVWSREIFKHGWIASAIQRSHTFLSIHRDKMCSLCVTSLWADNIRWNNTWCSCALWYWYVLSWRQWAWKMCLPPSAYQWSSWNHCSTRGMYFNTDNFYTSPILASFLLQNQTYLCGTVKRNHKHYYKDIRNVILEKGTASFYQTSNVNNKMLAYKCRASKAKADNKP